MRILLAEDDAVLGNGIQTWLSVKGYAVDWFLNGHEASQALNSTDYDLALLDLGLPRVDGMTLLRQIRARDDGTPVIVITARDSLTDRVVGLDSGADDYLVKPFELEELAARIRALERRRHNRANPVLCHGGLTLDPATMTVTLDGVSLNISPREYVVLRTLLENKGKPVSRDKLEHHLYAWGDEVESNTVTVHIHNLRKKLGEDFIVTKRGFGYLVE
jgi:two-component system response regulator QseB